MRGPIIASIASTSTLYVSGSTSTNTGTRPARTIGAMSVENVTADVMISSPGCRPSSSTARYSAEEPELHMTPRRLPNSSAIALLERADVLADAQRLRPAAQHGDDRLDLAVVVDAARVVDASGHALTGEMVPCVIVATLPRPTFGRKR